MKVADIRDRVLSLLQGEDWLLCTDSYAAWTARLEKAPPIDVVIPFFGSADDLDDLISAAALWEGVRRVIVVDDCSPAPARARPISSDLVVVRNERNIGFVSSVNRGIGLAEDADVVVLNSDTKADGSWLRRLKLSAYAFDRVASVSPLSNAAGFFSVPNARSENDVPQGLDGETCSRILNFVSPRMHEEVVATSGFCWYLRRDALREVGLLDDRLFYRGYGEDNDFCRRASAMGFKNLCNLQTFVAHTRGKSFGLEKISLKQVNRKILDALDLSGHASMAANEANSTIPDVGAAFGAFIATLCGRSVDEMITLPKRYCIVAPEALGTTSDQLEMAPEQQNLSVHWRGTTTTLSVPHARLADFLSYLNLRFGMSGIDRRAGSVGSAS
jgi:GT2 family glycosyltransferase